eukprot:2855051-Rhodomonas_salina.1
MALHTGSGPFNFNFNLDFHLHSRDDEAEAYWVKQEMMMTRMTPMMTRVCVCLQAAPSGGIFGGKDQKVSEMLAGLPLPEFEKRL